MNKFVKGDFVCVTTGSKKNFKGIILKFLGNRVQIKNFEIIKKKVKLNCFKKNNFIFKNFSFLIHISNISLLNNNLKFSKLGVLKLFNNKKIKYFKK